MLYSNCTKYGKRKKDYFGVQVGNHVIDWIRRFARGFQNAAGNWNLIICLGCSVSDHEMIYMYVVADILVMKHGKNEKNSIEQYFFTYTPELP